MPLIAQTSQVNMLSTCLSPEVQLLLCSGHIRHDGTADAATQHRVKALLAHDIQWDRLIELALYHKMLPLLCQLLSQNSQDCIPASIRDRFHEMASDIAMRNMALTRELLRLLALLHAHEIDALTFKGPALTSSLYDHLALRLFGDLDIIVPPPDILRARDLLFASGYRPLSTSEKHASEAAMLRDGHALHIEHETNHILVDLHWRLGGALSPLPLTFAHLWQHHQAVSLLVAPGLAAPGLGTAVKTFRTEDLLIYLCVHGAKHVWYKLGWICDIATLVRRHPDLMNSALMARAKACGVERMVRLGLLAARQYFGAPVPRAIYRQAEADAVIIFLLEEVHQRLFAPSPATDRHIGPRLYRRYLQLIMRERLRDQMSLLLAVISAMLRPTRRDREALPLPLWASSLYYIWRPLHLLQRHGRRQLRRRFPVRMAKSVSFKSRR